MVIGLLVLLAVAFLGVYEFGHRQGQMYARAKLIEAQASVTVKDHIDSIERLWDLVEEKAKGYVDHAIHIQDSLAPVVSLDPDSLAPAPAAPAAPPAPANPVQDLAGAMAALAAAQTQARANIQAAIQASDPVQPAAPAPPAPSPAVVIANAASAVLPGIV